MFLDDITEEREVIGTVKDNITSESFDIIIKKGGSFNNHTEYKIDLKKKDETVGYLKFVPDLHGSRDYVLSALKTQPLARGMNLSDALVEVLFQYAELNNTALMSTVQQRKPLTAFILQKYGFEPTEDKPRDRVEILGRYQESYLLIAFRDPVKRREFENSNLCQNSQQYKVVSPKPALLEDTVTLLSPYLLTDEDKCRNRREYTQRRFEINFPSG